MVVLLRHLLYDAAFIFLYKADDSELTRGWHDTIS